jgi:hypothetical protein
MVILLNDQLSHFFIWARSGQSLTSPLKGALDSHSSMSGPCSPARCSGPFFKLILARVL